MLLLRHRLKNFSEVEAGRGRLFRVRQDNVDTVGIDDWY